MEFKVKAMHSSDLEFGRLRMGRRKFIRGVFGQSLTCTLFA